MKSLREVIRDEDGNAFRYFWWRESDQDQWQPLIVTEVNGNLFTLQFPDVAIKVSTTEGQWIEMTPPGPSQTQSAILTSKEVVELW